MMPSSNRLLGFERRFWVRKVVAFFENASIFHPQAGVLRAQTVIVDGD